MAPQAQPLEELGYHVLELVKNGVRAARRVEVGVLFRADLVEVVVMDDGDGIDDLDTALLMSTGQGHGLQGALDFADWLCLETQGRRFAKSSRQGVLREVGRSQLRKGTRIDLVKLRQGNQALVTRRDT